LLSNHVELLDLLADDLLSLLESIVDLLDLVLDLSDLVFGVSDHLVEVLDLLIEVVDNIFLFALFMDLSGNFLSLLQKLGLVLVVGFHTSKEVLNLFQFLLGLLIVHVDISDIQLELCLHGIINIFQLVLEFSPLLFHIDELSG
jgi:hypothetical protein